MSELALTYRLASPRERRRPMKTLSEVTNFGAIAAEDDDIKRFFVQTPVYSAIASGERQVVIGRKGSGKTALYLALLDQAAERSSHARGLTFSDYPWSLFAKYSYELTTRHERFSASWRFLTALEIFKVLLTLNDRDSRFTNKNAKAALAAVESFIQNNWGLIAFDYKKTFPSGGLKIDGISVNPEFAGFSVGGVTISRTGGLGETVERLNEWLWHALAAVAVQAPPVYVLFDELDAGFNPNSEEYVERLIGLLLAIRRMAREFAALHAHFYPIAFLRSDIYDGLYFGDKNKLTSANVAEVSWNDDLEYHDSSLKHLIDHRIREAMDLPAGVADPWSHAFDERFMRGTQHKFHHMTFRSHLRPRDIIEFANCALATHKSRVRSEGRDSRISNTDMRLARAAYSKSLRKELDDEIASGHPKWNAYLEVLRRIKETKFTWQAFESSHRLVTKQFELDKSAEELIRFFYRYSIVGFERSPGAAGLEYHFRYLDEGIHFQPDARSFRVHRGLKEELDLRDKGEPSDEVD